MSKKAGIIVISGPSGVGKSTITNIVSKRLNIPVSVSATTRQQAKDEIDGKTYWFISQQAFQEKLKRGEFLEYAQVFDNWYGTPKDKVDELLKNGKSVILEIDTQGGIAVKKLYPDAIMIFILPPCDTALKDRLNGRGRESNEEVIQKRLANASNEIETARKHYEKLVINDVLDTAVSEIISIIKTEINL